MRESLEKFAYALVLLWLTTSLVGGAALYPALLEMLGELGGALFPSYLVAWMIVVFSGRAAVIWAARTILQLVEGEPQLCIETGTLGSYESVDALPTTLSVIVVSCAVATVSAPHLLSSPPNSSEGEVVTSDGNFKFGPLIAMEQLVVAPIVNTRTSIEWKPD